MADAASQEKPTPEKGAQRWLKAAKDWIAASLKRELWHVPLRLWFPPLLVLVASILWLWFLPWLYPFPVKKQTEDPAYLYLLSALSQGMAAVLALTFTISLVAAQLTARYSYRLVERLLTPFTIGYILLFALAVVLPLVLLPSPTPLQVKLSLSLGALALALLVPYFRYFLKRTSPRPLLEELSREAEKKLRAGQEVEEIEEIETIEDVAASAVPLNDYRTYYLAQEKLGELALIRQSRVK